MGHNEDGALTANTTSYIVSAEVTSEDGDRFTAFCYAGELCGSAFGYSDTTGKVFSSNAVFPKNINTNAVGQCDYYGCSTNKQYLSVCVYV